MLKRLKAACLSLILGLGIISGSMAGLATTVAAGDCDDNAVIRCGVSSTAELKQKCVANQGGNVQDVFRYFGISNCSTALDGMVPGRITSDNKVYVGDILVATNAVTAGRQNMPGSKPILNGAFYERPPSVSFRSGSLAALVKMNGDRFAYAVILDCGNPVKATPVAPPPKPQPVSTFACTSLDIRRINRTTYQLTAKGMTENATITGYVFKINNVVKQDAASNTYTYKNETAGTFTATVQVKTNKGTTPIVPICSEQIIIEKELETPVYRCDALHVTQENRKVTVRTDHTAEGGATFSHVSYDYGDGTVTRDNTHTYAKNGTYMIKATAFFTVNGKEQQHTASACTAQVTFTDTPVTTVSTPPTPVNPATTPTVLPSTGPAAVFSLFGITSILGMTLYRLKEFYLARLSR